MKYFQKLILLGIIIFTPLFSQSIEIPHRMMHQDTTYNVPIFIYDVTDLESIQLKIEYDHEIVIAESIIENPLGVLGSNYTYTTNISSPGEIELAIGSNSANLFTGNGMVAQIKFNSLGHLGDFSPISILDAQINSNWQVSAVDGSIEIVLSSLTITGQDNLENGAFHSIILGMCNGCTDSWKFGEDEYDYPNPVSGDYTNINFHHLDWYGLEDANGNTCDQIDFATDFRKQHSFRELTSWGIKGSIGGDIPLDTPVNIIWDSGILLSSSTNFKIFIFVGETKYNMQELNTISISQSELDLIENEPNIWVKMGGCAETGETQIYYRDFDGDGLGSSLQGEFCLGFQILYPNLNFLF